MKALKCKTLGASVIHCIANINIYTISGQMRECTGKYTENWQRQKL